MTAEYQRKLGSIASYVNRSLFMGQSEEEVLKIALQKCQEELPGNYTVALPPSTVTDPEARKEIILNFSNPEEKTLWILRNS